MAKPWTIGIYSVNAIDASLISSDGLLKREGDYLDCFTPIEVTAVDAKDSQISDASAKAGGYKKQERAQERIFKIALSKMSFPSEMHKKRAIEKILRKHFIFLSPEPPGGFGRAYPDPDSICPIGYAIKVAGKITQEDDHDYGDKYLTIELTASVPIINSTVL